MGLRTWLRKKLKSEAKKNQQAKAPPVKNQLPVESEPATQSEIPLFKLHKYEKDGLFDYDAYRNAQIGKAKNDTGDVWADPKTLDLIANHALSHIGRCTFVLCHGSKSGMESNYLAKKLGCEGLGTDIAPPEHAKHVVEWDFHEWNEAWVKKASVIYTNALDHSYNPKTALDNWINQLAPGGRIYIEHTALHGPSGAGKSDPFGADPFIMPYLVLEWGQGAYCVQEIIKAPHKKPHWKQSDGVRQDTDLDVWIFVIARLPASSCEQSSFSS